MKKKTYEEVKNFIEIESKSECKLLNTEYINDRQYLDIQCKCGNPFSTTFDRFRSNNQRQCKECSWEIKKKQYKWNNYTTEDFINIVKQRALDLGKPPRINNFGSKFNLPSKEAIISKLQVNTWNDVLELCEVGKTRREKYNINEVKAILNTLGFNLLSDKYKDNKQELIFKDKEGYLFSMSLHELTQNIKRENYPRIVGIYNPYSLENIRLWCELNNKPFRLLSDIYVESNENLKFKCLKEECGEVFKASWIDISTNRGCPFCRGLQVGLSNCLVTKNPELAKEWHPTKNGDLTPYDVTCGSHKYIWWKCSKCSNEWQTYIYCRSGGTGCPECSESHGEKKVTEWLRLNNIFYIYQKEFKGLFGLGSGLLSYDFYLLKYNLLIEYQGNYHDGTVSNQSKEDFEKQQEHDRRKREYAKKHNIDLLEIWYWDFDNIDEILESIIKNERVQNFEITELKG